MNFMLKRQRVKRAVDLTVKKARQPHTIKRRAIIVKDTEQPDSFLGLGKRARARKDERVAIRNEKKRAKIEDRSYKKKVKADALAKRYGSKNDAAIISAQGEADVNMALAQQGVVGNPVQKQPDTASQLLGAASGLLGGAGNGDSQAPAEDVKQIDESQLNASQLGIKNDNTNADGSQKKNNTMLYIIIAGVAVAAFLFFKKK